jgi:hypothetical protein
MEQVLFVPFLCRKFWINGSENPGDLALNEADHFRNADFAVPIRLG